MINLRESGICNLPQAQVNVLVVTSLIYVTFNPIQLNLYYCVYDHIGNPTQFAPKCIVHCSAKLVMHLRTQLILTTKGFIERCHSYHFFIREPSLKDSPTLFVTPLWTTNYRAFENKTYFSNKKIYREKSLISLLHKGAILERFPILFVTQPWTTK